MRSFVTTLLLLTFAPAAARATQMPENAPPPATTPPPTPSTAAPPPVTLTLTPPDAQAEWERRFLWFEDWVAYNVRSGAIVNSWSRPVEGKYRKPLAYGDFYAKVGRADLADRYRTRRNVKIGLGVAGGLAFVGGFIAIFAQLKSNNDAFSSCVDNNIFHGGGGNCSNLDNGSGGYVAGGVLLGVGFAGVMAALFTPVQPVQPYEARELADQYNQKLRVELGVDRPAPPPAPAAATSFTLAPSVDSKGAGLRLVARF